MSNMTNTKNTRSKVPRRAVCYIRVASAQAQGSAVVEQQRQACECTAQELGATIVDVYADTGTTSAMKKRPALQALLAGLQSAVHTNGDHIDYVIAYDLARLTRNYEEYCEITQALEAAGVELVVASVPGTGPRHKFMLTMSMGLSELSAQYRRDICRAKKEAS
jgi:DNA invertase Pin-like site-specific DNA recombinase